VPDRVSAFLLGEDPPEDAIAGLISTSPPAGAEAIPMLADSLRAGQELVYIRERPGASGIALAVAALRGAGLDAICADLRRLRPDQEPHEVAALLTREARLRDRGLVVGPLEALGARGAAAVQPFAEAPGVRILCGAGNWDPAWGREVPLCCDAPLLEPLERARLWQAHIDGEAAPGVDVGVTGGPYRLAPENIVRAASAARLQARAAGRAVSHADLRAGARAQNAAGLERLAQRIEPSVRFEDLVLSPDALDQLRDLVVRARHREMVLGRWAMAGPASRRRGLAALFAGPSGTGKTMAAEVLAAEMGLDLYVVDLASVVDKYVGETEKNLDRIFAEAESVNGVLLFDEADALFGKRSDVSDAHDRYANVEVAYLLQRMELFEGIAILATNLRSNLDEAFSRRLDVMVDFPEPEKEDRLRLWRRCLGTAAPVTDDLDLEFLAVAFRLSGGNIRNIAVSAAYAAAEEGTPIGMGHLVRATQREYRKLGRMVVESEFGRYYSLIR
jgi:SpoVK/Ycf46/Vps4 family AAA+-type ATPase